MQFFSAQGPFCRDCGVATFRLMTGRTLVQGWWGPLSFFITPVVILINIVRVKAVDGLPAPAPHPDGRSVRPMPVGKPLLRRPVIVGALVPLALVGLFVTAVIAGSKDPETLIGQCIVDEPAGFVPCTTPHDGEVIAVTESDQECPDETVGVIKDYGGAPGKVLCIK